MIRNTSQCFRGTSDGETMPYHLGRQVPQEGQSAQNKYRIVLENMEEAYFELDHAGSIVFFNPSTVEMLGYPAEDVLNMNYRQYVFPETAKRLFKIFNTIYRTGKPAEIFDYQIIRKDGTRRFREMSASLIRDSHLNPIGFRCLARDVTKRKQAEERLRHKEEELKRKSASLIETHAALNVLLQQREEDKVEFKKNVMTSVMHIVAPYVDVLKKSRLTADQMTCVDVLETSLNNITSPFLRNITLHRCHLTPKEFRVATLIKEGKTTKEMATFFKVSPAAVDYHRNRIRKKLGLNDRKINLRSYLVSLS